MTPLLVLFTWFTLPVLAETPACHPLDFDSYFIAQQAKSNLQKINDLSQPNFAEHYLLLKNAMMMETVYLIADCRSGKFLHEKLGGNAQFKVTSNEVSVTEPNTRKNETFIWNGERFLKTESKSDSAVPSFKNEKAIVVIGTPADTKKPEAEPVMSRYDELFAKFPAKDSLADCKAPDFESFFEAQKGKSSILKAKPDLSKPNFAGRYLMVKSESLFDVQQLIADCTQGKFLHLSLKGDAVFRKDSRLLRLEHSGSFPDLYVFDGDDWLQIPDPVQNHKRSIKNSLSVKSSELLFRSLPNPKRLSLLRFENLGSTPETQALFDSLAVPTIHAGKCSTEKGSPRCEVETE